MDRPVFRPTALDLEALLNYLQELTDYYPFLGVEYIGETIMGRPICAAVFGEGKTEYMYISGHHGSEWITGLSLIRFLYELCEAHSLKRRIYGADTDFIMREKRLVIIPLLNVDGAELQQHGIDENNPLKDRILRMNGDSTDFSHWQANIRGVDLNHNYNAGWLQYKKIEQENGIACGAPTKYSGACPESEPECGAVCAYVRAHSVRSLISLHTQGEEIYYSSLSSCPVGARAVASRIASVTGYKTSAPSGSAAYGGLIDWFIAEYDRPAFTLECGKGVNPLPLSDEAKIYFKLRKLLFSFPMML
ncbi:MAG: hypothetical protein E7619_10390 [Ruminococcaceae bacterium]|nr:hypothetical protein [Oscillospiraceae bacterium]